MQRLPSLLLFFVLSYSAAALGAAFPPGDWYDQLNKPTWTPPGWLFGPVWTALYAMIAVAGWRLYRARGDSVRPALGAWGVQMVLNAAWSWLFFGLHRPGLAFAEIVLLWISIVVTIALARRHDRWAAGLLAPYLAWVSFASALNFVIWRMNPGT